MSATSDAYTPAHVPEVRPGQWVPINRAGFSSWVQETFTYDTSKVGLFPHQRFVRDFLQAGGPNRGLLLYHGLGVGKTAASIAIADALMGEGYKAAVLLPAFLRANYISEVMRYGSPLFRPDQRWCFQKYVAAGKQRMEQLEGILHLPKGWAKSAGGIWVPHSLRGASRTVDYNSMPDEERESVRAQITAMIESTYMFVHYNGLRRESITTMTKGNTVNPFDDRVIIIDEVHNFISRVVGGGLVAPMVYQLLMRARGAKIVALSGTPVINHPHEFAVLANLLRGPLVRHVLKFNIGPKKKQGGPALLDDVQLASVLKPCPRVDECAMDLQRKAVTLTLLPDGFGFTDDMRTHVTRLSVADPIATEDGAIADVSERLKRNAGVNLSAATGAHKREVLELLPADSKDFNERFIDFSANTVRNPEMLAQRLQGLVSFFRVYSPELYPRVAEPVIVATPMSHRQFEAYSEVRETEREREERARRNARRRGGCDEMGCGDGGKGGDVFRDTSNTYRCFSRAVCNFAFPKDVTRPYPSKLTQASGELDDPDFDEDVAEEADAMATKAKKQAGGAGAKAKAMVAADVGAPTRRTDTARAYQAALARALRTLKAKARRWLGPGESSLAALSPKFAAVIERLQECPGCALVYSTFRNVEGLGVLAMALDAHGWEELHVFRNPDDGEWDVDVGNGETNSPRYLRFVGEREFAQVVLDIYNSDWERLPERLRTKIEAVSPGRERNLRGGVVRVMMITQSGSEGISLKNVRQVHIVEPYWNQVRLDQVLGRAVRAGSHLALPSSERSVESFIYVARFTPEQAHAMRADEGRTSDEFIHGVARRKAAIVDSVLGIVRKSAVDAQLYNAVSINKKNGKKKAAKKKTTMDASSGGLLAYPADIARHTQDADVAVSKREKHIVQVAKVFSTVTVRGVRYAYDADEGTLYDHAAAQEQPARLVPLGRVERTPAGKTRVTMFAAVSTTRG